MFIACRGIPILVGFLEADYAKHRCVIYFWCELKNYVLQGQVFFPLKMTKELVFAWKFEMVLLHAER